MKRISLHSIVATPGSLPTVELHTTDACAPGGYLFTMSRKVSELNELHPLDCLVVAQVRTQHADDGWLYHRGYIRYQAGGRPLRCEHQYVAQAAYGIPSGYHVHHVDGNPLNNRADNLLVVSVSEHSRIHKPNRNIVLQCPVCDKVFEVKSFRAKKCNATYCSRACRGFAERKVERPSPQYLAELIHEIGNWSRLGDMFGVSDNSVRNWARIYGLR